MSVGVTTTGDPRALALAGVDGADGGPIVHLGPGGEGADVVWREGTARGGGGRKVIAQDGTGLWRCAPWPVRDELFELASPAARNILVVGDERDREKVHEWLDPDDGRVRDANVLERADLEDAAVVLFAQPDGRPLPGPAFAVLATRRVLVVRNPSVSFGLLPGIDHLAARTAAGAVQLAIAVLLHWDAFAGIRAYGTVAADPHRASTVYARLARDLELDAR